MTKSDGSFDERLESMLRDAAPDRFADGFTERVAARLRAQEPPLANVLERQFVRIVPILAAASLILGAYNWWGARATSASVVDAVLRLPQATIASAYSTDALFGSSGLPMEQP